MTIHVVGLLGGRPVGVEATTALAAAGLVAGSKDQLAAVADLLAPGARTSLVGAGLAALDDVFAHDAADDERGVACVLASGDPGFHGILRTLSRRVATDRLIVHPAPTSVALAFARMGLPWDDAVVASAHQGDAMRAAAEVAGARVAAVLCGPAAPPEAIGAALATLGADHELVAVASRLGEPGEAVHRLDGVADLAQGTYDHRSVVVLGHRRPADGGSESAASRRPLGGRPIADFAHRAGMITKPEIRSVILGALDLPAQGVLLDIGAGSGSVAIEAALAQPGLRVIAVERNEAAAEQIHDNALALGAFVEVVVGGALDVLMDLPAPDRIFVGGGGLDVLDACIDRCRSGGGGRVVASFAAADRALAARARLGELVQVSVDRAVDLPDGGVRFAADNPVFVAWGDVVARAEVDLDRQHVVVGVGCSTHATAADVANAVELALASLPEAQRRALAVRAIASIDRRRDHAAFVEVARALGVPAVTFPASLLGDIDVPNPSEVVAAAVGTASVAEAAALLAAGPRALLAVAKVANGSATAAIAVARRTMGPSPGCVTVVGLGPGGARHRTPAAVAAVRQADAVVGYGPYVDAARSLLRPDQRVIRLGMGAEAERAEIAVALARAGWRVAVVSSGDPGVFAMASVTLEVATEQDPPVAVEVVPGVTAANAAAAAAGAPLAGPYAALTLSDLLLPWADIEAQLRAVAAAKLALAIYNPRSKGRPEHLDRARAVLLEALAGDTPVVVVTDATGPSEDVVVTTLAELDTSIVGMRSIVLVGSVHSTTVASEAEGGTRVVTRRYHPRPERREDGQP